MIKKSSSSIQTTRAEEHFTGIAWIDRLVKDEKIACNAYKVTFEPTARNYWHTHPAGQILIATGGKGFIQKKGERIQMLLPGDVVTILADEEYWHGATHDSIFTHVAIQLSVNGRDISWLKEVTDEEYYSYPKHMAKPRKSVVSKFAH